MTDIAKFEDLLRDAAEKAAEVRLVPSVNPYSGDVEFYAHIDGHNSETVDIAICPRLSFLQLRRGADGVRGEAAKAHRRTS